MAKPSVKHLAAILMLFDYMVTGGVLPAKRVPQHVAVMDAAKAAGARLMSSETALLSTYPNKLTRTDESTFTMLTCSTSLLYEPVKIFRISVRRGAPSEPKVTAMEVPCIRNA